jgi:hypothetical protein
MSMPALRFLAEAIEHSSDGPGGLIAQKIGQKKTMGSAMAQRLSSLNFFGCRLSAGLNTFPNFLESCSADKFTRMIPSVPIDIGSEGCLEVLDDLKIVAHSVSHLLSIFVAGKDVGSACRPEAQHFFGLQQARAEIPLCSIWKDRRYHPVGLFPGELPRCPDICPGRCAAEQ